MEKKELHIHVNGQEWNNDTMANEDNTTLESEAFAMKFWSKGGKEGVQACTLDMMSKNNPRTDKPYTRAEAKKICSAIGQKRYGKARFQKIGTKTKQSFISSLESQLLMHEEVTDMDGETYRRFLYKVADDKTIGKEKDGDSLSGYSGESLMECMESFIGEPVVLNHDGDMWGGMIFDSWADETEEGVSGYQVLNIYNPKMAKMMEDGYKPSIKTIPTETVGGKVVKFEGVHTGILTPGRVPGCEDGGLIKELHSDVGNEEEVKIMTKEKTYTEDEMNKLLESSVAEKVKEAEERVRKELDMNTLESSIKDTFGLKSEVLDAIKGGDEMEALRALESSLQAIRDDVTKTVISQKSDETAEGEEEEDEEETPTIVSTIRNTAEKNKHEEPLEITTDDDSRFKEIQQNIRG